MKNKLLFFFSLTLLLILLFVSCDGDRNILDLKITGGLKTEYTLNEEPDFSGVVAVALYNDGTVENLTADKLSFGHLNTGVIGDHQLNIAYNGYSISVQITVKGIAQDESPADGHIITAVSLPESLALWNSNKKDFSNQTRDYVVGDDNPFFFTLKLSAYSADGEKLNITSYTSTSFVYFKGSSTPLSDDELAKYVSIDEEKNSFDFTDAAIGQSFTLSTRPRYGVDGVENEMTRTLTLTVVDGYNIYKPYELNYITNDKTNGFPLNLLYSGETRTQYQIVTDFLANEKGVIRPEGLSGIVIHNNMTLERTDIPKEYFYQKDRNNGFYDGFTIFKNATTEENKNFTIHGNYFAIYSYNLPCVIEKGVGNQTNEVSCSQLFGFSSTVSKDMNFDHTEYSATIKDLLLLDKSPYSDNEDNVARSVLGLTAITTNGQVTNLDNVIIQAFFISLRAEYDYQTVNLKDCILTNSWSNHLHVISLNNIQNPDDEPLSKELYPRLTLNVSNSQIMQSGGPAILMQTKWPEYNKNKHSGPAVNISEDSKVESWVTGDEAWFKALKITVIAQLIKGFDKNLQTLDSTFIKEEIRNVNGKPTSFKLVNIIAVNLLVPDSSKDFSSMMNQILGNVDIDGKLSVGDKTILDMDDRVINGVISNFANPTVSELKQESNDNHVLESSGGGVGCVGTNHPFAVESGDLSAKTPNDFLSIYFYSAALLIGNYRPIQ